VSGGTSGRKKSRKSGKCSPSLREYLFPLCGTDPVYLLLTEMEICCSLKKKIATGKAAIISVTITCRGE